MRHLFPSWLLLVRCGVLVTCCGALAIAQCTTVSTNAYWETTWPGCGNLPVLLTVGNPQLGTVALLRTTNLPANTLLGVTWFTLGPPGVATNDLFGFPFGARCANYIPSPPYWTVGLESAGVIDVALAIPANPLLLGQNLHAQSAVPDLFSSTIAFPDVSNAVCLHLGN